MTTTAHSHEKLLTQHLDDYLKPLATAENFSGVIFVAQNGSVLYNKAYGFAHYEQNIPNSPETIFKIASITKLFTATLILQLQKEGLLKTSDSLSKYIPDYPHGDMIALSHLLSHSSGIPNISELSAFETASKFPTTMQKSIELFKHEPLEFQPGSQFKYSNSNYTLLSFIIEKVTGKSFAQIVQEHILEPAQMHNSYYVGNAPENSIATGYSKKDGTLSAVVPFDPSWPVGSGGLCMTAYDLYLFDQALNSAALLDEEQRKTLFAPVIAGKSLYMKHMSHYGYGCELGIFNNHRYAGHPGGMDGFRSQYLQFPDDKITIIVLSNFEFVPAQIIAFDIAKIVFAS